MDEEFAPGKLLPPLHPRCKCCIMYVKSKSMAAAYETEKDDLKEYTEDEIQKMSKQMSDIADKHLNLDNAWSGKVIVDDDSGVYGIQWNGDIITRHETAPHICYMNSYTLDQLQNMIVKCINSMRTWKRVRYSLQHRRLVRKRIYKFLNHSTII